MYAEFLSRLQDEKSRQVSSHVAFAVPIPDDLREIFLAPDHPAEIHLAILALADAAREAVVMNFFEGSIKSMQSEGEA